MKKKLYVVRKYVLATSVTDAIAKEKKVKPEEVFIHDSSMPTLIETNKIGFNDRG